MKISVVHAGLFKLDGGAMFGVVPKKMWGKIIESDENNMVTWATRSILIEQGDRKILVDTGIGNKQDDKFRSHFEPHGDMDLMGSLMEQNINTEEITDVFLTHLHFDHVGGAVYIDKDGKFKNTFPNATYWSNEKQWNWAMEPNMREKASFLKENFVPLKDSGRLKFIDVQRDPVKWMDNLDVHFTYGHTEAMMILHAQTERGPLVFCADLMPSVHHIGLPYVMSYDIRPLNSLEEKEALATGALEGNWNLFMEHDANNEVCTVKKNERGRIVIDKIFNW